MRGFVPNPRFEAELRREPGVRRALQERAEKAIAAAQGDVVSPKFASGFYVEDNGDSVTAGTTNPFFHLDEWGSVNTPPRAPLRRAVRATGARLEESGP